MLNFLKPFQDSPVRLTGVSPPLYSGKILLLNSTYIFYILLPPANYWVSCYRDYDNVKNEIKYKKTIINT